MSFLCILSIIFPKYSKYLWIFKQYVYFPPCSSWYWYVWPECVILLYAHILFSSMLLMLFLRFILMYFHFYAAHCEWLISNLSGEKLLRRLYYNNNYNNFEIYYVKNSLCWDVESGGTTLKFKPKWFFILKL